MDGVSDNDRISDRGSTFFRRRPRLDDCGRFLHHVVYTRVVDSEFRIKFETRSLFEFLLLEEVRQTVGENVVMDIGIDVDCIAIIEDIIYFVYN